MAPLLNTYLHNVIYSAHDCNATSDESNIEGRCSNVGVAGSTVKSVEFGEHSNLVNWSSEH